MKIGGENGRLTSVRLPGVPRRPATPGSGQGSGLGKLVATAFLIGDTHYGVENDDVGNPNTRQIQAIIEVPVLPHPLGGFVGKPDVVVQLGDAVHEDSENMTRFQADYKLNGTGTIPFPCYVFDGNHDRAQVRDHIVATHGSLTWGFKLGPCYFQVMTENYVAPFNTAPPSQTQIENIITPLLAARPAQEPFFLMVHRSLSTVGYEGEWAAGALNAMEAMLDARNCVGIIHGHDHYTHHGNWRGYKTISPGSVTQSPTGLKPPGGYLTTYPESFVVLRMGTNWYDIASYVFGFNRERVWQPGTWEWAEKVFFTI